ncbi:LysR substrate-binding domain-containing protein [Kitasatospora sp. GP82]|uniref:LysR family transcriptional regulator n=1 Tax=Kitasatospora sp. GP82 TaxID=3035089 RepID=UPI00247382F6|nr:LysR substrate-binding domain-containing protein [Kitasatospora sp. GP82]MDH6127447.1 DNA-binding transcriptional LysR family regulator [Kitasatospora sp. GP82]
MELRHLECFVAVAEELNFTRASQRLHVVQSGVSASIKALERELGIRLLERTSQRVALTDAGAALLPHARATLDAAQAARDAVDEVRGGLRGSITVGTLISVAAVDLPSLLGRFHAEHPEVKVRLRVSPSGSAGLAKALQDGELDVAFLLLPGSPPPGITPRDLLSVSLVVVVRADHLLADQDEVPLARLAEESFIDFPVGYGNRTVADQAFAAAGIQRQVALEVTEITTGAQYVRNGFGVALLPDFVAPADPELRTLRVSDHPLRWTLSVATSTMRRPSAAVRALLEVVDQWHDRLHEIRA